jgi:CubicO group peptidase (beta-lactamase class C family)
MPDTQSRPPLRKQRRIALRTALLIAIGLGAVQADAADFGRSGRVGLSAERLERLDDFAKRYIKEEKLAGMTLAVMRKGKLAYNKSFGMADRERGIAQSDNDIYRIHSMTKPIASVALMMLYEEGRFDLSDPIAMYIPQFQDLKVFNGVNQDGTFRLTEAARPPTLQDLMTHSAGFAFGRSTDPISQVYQARDFRAGTLKDMIDKIADVPLLYQPGTRWSYSISVDIQAYLVEVLSGQTFDVFMQTRILDPLRMVDTGFHVPAQKATRLAAAYDFKDGKISLADDPETSRYLKKPTFFSGSEGLVSTTSDYLRFAEMMLNGGELDGARILSPKTVELMTQNHLADGVTVHLYAPSNMGFGLGVQVRTSMTKDPGTGSVGEYGWGGAASTYFWIDPEEELIGLLMTQFYPSNAYRIRKEFHTLVYQAIIE